MLQPSPVEILIFLALLAASGYAFWRRIGPVIDTIRRSTKTGRPAGSPEFYVRLEYDIGRSLTPRRRGRKAKW